MPLKKHNHPDGNQTHEMVRPTDKAKATVGDWQLDQFLDSGFEFVSKEDAAEHADLIKASKARAKAGVAG
jgi:hypothetical protein